MIKACECRSDYQDAKYGAGRRVMNLSKDKAAVRCTVCGKEYQIGSVEKKKGKG
jgi:hypothetical protein